MFLDPQGLEYSISSMNQKALIKLRDQTGHSTMGDYDILGNQDITESVNSGCPEK